MKSIEDRVMKDLAEFCISRKGRFKGIYEIKKGNNIEYKSICVVGDRLYKYCEYCKKLNNKFYECKYDNKI